MELRYQWFTISILGQHSWTTIACCIVDSATSFVGNFAENKEIERRGDVHVSVMVLLRCLSKLIDSQKRTHCARHTAHKRVRRIRGWTLAATERIKKGHQQAGLNPTAVPCPGTGTCPGSGSESHQLSPRATDGEPHRLSHG